MKKIFNFLRLALLCALLFTSYRTYSNQKVIPGFVIKGYIIGVKDGTLVTLIDIEGQKVLDSAYIMSGKFELQGSVIKPSTCYISCLKEYAIVQVENIVMTFKSPITEMKTNYIATGGKEQTLQTQLNQLQRKYERVYLSAYDSLTRKLYVDSIQRSRLVKVFNVANDAYMNIYVSFGKKHIDSYLGLDIVYRNRNVIPKDSVVLLYKALPAFLKNTSNAAALKVFISENVVKKGDHFQDFQVLDIKGEPFKLSALKNKYIYLTFGSVGCGPCRLENKEISKNYDSLSKNVAIVNFSLDVNKVEWEAAAKADGIIWYNVSDMAGMSGKIKTLYGVQDMPTSFLIDKNGIIVEKFDGYSPDNFKEVERIVTTNIYPR